MNRARIFLVNKGGRVSLSSEEGEGGCTALMACQEYQSKSRKSEI